MLPTKVQEFADSLCPAVAPDAPATHGGFDSREASRAAALWRAVAQIPVPKRAMLAADGSAVTLQLETSDAAAGKRALVERTALLPDCRVLPTIASAVCDEGAAPVFASPSKARTIRFVKIDDGWATEVRDNGTGAILARVASGKAHGAPLQDDSLQQVSWSRDECTAVFVAERFRQKAPPAWSPVSKGDNTARAANELRESLGEVYPDFSVTTLVQIDIPGAKVRDLISDQAFAADYSAASPVLTHDASRIVFVAYLHKPRRLGIAYCSSRTTKLFSLGVPAWAAEGEEAVAPAITERTFCRNVRCLTRHPTTDAIAAAVAAEDSLAHATCSSLVLINAADVRSMAAGPMPRKTLIDLVASPEATAPFPGLYMTSNSDLRWLNDETLLVNSVRGSTLSLYTINVDLPIPHLVHPEPQGVLGVNADSAEQFGTLRVLDTRGTAAVCSYSTTSRAPVVLYCPDVTKPGHQNWSVVLDAQQSLVAGIAAAASTFAGQLVVPTDSALHGTEAHLHTFAPAVSGAPNRTIVFVHGGPHACDTSAFSRSHFFWLLCGFNVMSINYGGSLGFGQRSVDDLGGNAGTNDVYDCLGTVEYAQERGLIPKDPAQLVITGGSHGGFLTAHITGQAPDAFCVAAMRNPVTNIASMVYETDIPDWCLFEAGAKEHDVARMLAASPMAHVAKVKTPTLIAIGRGDLRVPPAQGLAWFNSVRSNGHATECRMLDYAGVGHALDSVVAEAEFNIIAALWFAKHCRLPRRD